MRKFAIVVLTVGLALALVAPVLATSYLGSIVGSFNATAAVGAFRYYPLGLTYDGAEFWAGYSKYAAEWTKTGSRKSMYFINGGTNYDTAYNRGAEPEHLYAINKLSKVNRILTIDPGSGSITSSFVVPSPFTVPQGLTFGGGYLYIADMYQSRILKTTVNGSVVSSINPGVFAIKGLAWDGDTAGGPYLFACEFNAKHTIHQINPSSGSVVKSFDGPAFTGNIISLAWDGTYLWTCQNYAGQNMYAFGFIAYEPNVGISPASLGRVKALFK